MQLRDLAEIRINTLPRRRGSNVWGPKFNYQLKRTGPGRRTKSVSVRKRYNQISDDEEKDEKNEKTVRPRRRFNRIIEPYTSDESESEDEQVEFLKRVSWCARDYKKSELRSNPKIVLEQSDESKG